MFCVRKHIIATRLANVSLHGGNLAGRKLRNQHLARLYVIPVKTAGSHQVNLSEGELFAEVLTTTFGELI